MNKELTRGPTGPPGDGYRKCPWSLERFCCTPLLTEEDLQELRSLPTTAPVAEDRIRELHALLRQSLQDYFYDGTGLPEERYLAQWEAHFPRISGSFVDGRQESFAIYPNHEYEGPPPTFFSWWGRLIFDWYNFVKVPRGVKEP